MTADHITGKLENIISGHGINSDDAAWLRALAAQPATKLEDSEQYRMQMAAISTAALGYWTEADTIHPDYDTVPLRDVAKLYAKYDMYFRLRREAPAPAEGDAASVIAGIREGYRGTDWGKAAEAICDKLSEALANVQPKGAVSCIRASCAATGCDGFCVKRDSDAGVTAAQAPAPAPVSVPAGWTIRDRSDLEPGVVDIEGPGHPRINIGPNPATEGPRTLLALARAMLAAQAPAVAHEPVMHDCLGVAMPHYFDLKPGQRVRVMTGEEGVIQSARRERGKMYHVLIRPGFGGMYGAWEVTPIGESQPPVQGSQP